MSNIQTYQSDSVVRIYSTAENLQKPEQTILNKFKDQLGQMTMLDMGVGGGRTTLHFSNLVKEYIGIDYAENMIEACKKRFDNVNNTSFQVVDARDLSQFKDQTFDFVLFSFNGIDYINHDDRIKALKEIRRILKNDGAFVFSSHNLSSIPKLFTIKLSINPLKSAWRIFRLLKLIIKNGLPQKFKNMRWAIINDGAQNFGLHTYYITPSHQIEQLKDLNFKNIKLFSINSGFEINTSEIHKINESWIYYLCQV